MKIQIRQGVFETNSSSTHAVAILTDDQYQKYRNREIRISRNGEIITNEDYLRRYQIEREKARKSYETYETSEYAKKYHKSFDSYWKAWYDGVKYDFDENRMDIEHAEREINGVKVHALSVYGYES
jgi:hypothetical protein